MKEKINISAMNLMQLTQEQNGVSKEFPEFLSGNTITVHDKIRKGNKERIQKTEAW